MSLLTESPWIQEFGLEGASPPDFYCSLDQIDSRAPLQQAHILRQAWKQLDLRGVLCADGKPVAYVAEVADDNAQRLRDLHQAVWSQGVTPLLLAVTPTRVLVFSSLALPTLNQERVSEDGRLVETLDRIGQALEARQLVRSLQVGTFFDSATRTYDPVKSFDPGQRVDRYLLTNIDAARAALELVADNYDRLAVHRLLARVIFTCYLIDRGIIGGSYFDQLGAAGCSRLQDILARDDYTAKRLLFALFRALKEDFNGDLLEGDLDQEETKILPGHLEILRSLLRGDDLTRKQLALEFWAYDFSIIPIETISAIYESFLEADDPDERRDIGAYYTPRFLCEVVLDEVLRDLTPLRGHRFLDPACGSGIFLVGLFNRLAEERRRAAPIEDNHAFFAELKGLLQTSLFGIDINETACRIAAFSLYLALLDQLEPKDIQQLPKPRLPTLVLMKTDSTTNIENLNIVCSDFFDPFLSNLLVNFDVIVGNPPWTRKKQSHMQQWAKGQGVSVAQGQVAEGFVLKAPTHLGPNGRISLLLPAGVLFNHQAQSRVFQQRWLTTCTVHSVLNLADLRFYLFENAIRPALCVTYGLGRPKDNHRVEYFVPKSDPNVLRAEMLSLSMADTSSIQLGRVLRSIKTGQPYLEWKRHLWASPRDREFLERLDEYPLLERAFLPNSQGGLDWEIGEGFQPSLAKELEKKPEGAKRLSLDSQALYLDAKSKGLRLVVHPYDCSSAAKYNDKPLRRLPKESLFKAPHVLVSYSLRAAYCGFDVYFQHALRGIHGPNEEELMLLAAFLDSDLMRYYFFHTAANWGIERNKVHIEELRKMPFPLLSDLGADAKGIFEQIVGLVRKAGEIEQFGNQFAIDEIRSALQPLINRYFDVDENEQVLMRDSLAIWMQSSTPNRNAEIPALRSTDGSVRRTYVQRLCHAINGWTGVSSWRLNGRVILARGANLSVVQLRKVKSESATLDIEERESWEELDGALGRASAALRTANGTVFRVRDLKLFESDCIYLFKPLQQRYWAESVALADADEIAGAVLSQKMVGPG